MEMATYYPDIAEAPMSGAAYWIHADDGTRLRLGVWKTEGNKKGTVLLFPGRTEYIESFGHTVADFERAGFSTLVIDWRGHGLADRVTKDPMAGHVVHFLDYQKDVAAMIQAANELKLPKPWYLLGNSMGACIGLRALIEGLPVAACAFTIPMWDINLSLVERMAAWPVTWTAQAIGKGHIYAPGQIAQPYILTSTFEDNRRTSDKEMYEYLVGQARTHPDLQTGGVTMGWLYQALNETRRLSKIPSPNIPCISFCADKDELVGIPAIKDRMNRWHDGRLVLIQNAKHDLLVETPEVRDQIMTEVVSLFDAAREK